MKRLIDVSTGIVGAAVVTHVVMTAFENSPDAKISFGTRSTLLGRLPQWRFFAPTPGIDNTHLLFRSRASATHEWGEWDEVPVTHRTTWLALIWNPDTRGPKALFDCTQHLRLMRNVGLSWSSVLANPAYQTLEHAVRVAARERGHDEAQFMIVVSRNQEGPATLQPLLVSDPTESS